MREVLYSPGCPEVVVWPGRREFEWGRDEGEKSRVWTYEVGHFISREAFGFRNGMIFVFDLALGPYLSLSDSDL